MSTTDCSAHPLVSVIIRSMGRLSLRQAMDAVVAQTYPYIEMVIVNAKGDGHPVLSDHYGRVPVRCVESIGEKPTRRSRAANIGLAHAQGHYCLFLDDDDWLLPPHIAALVDALGKSPRFQIAYAGVQCLRETEDGARKALVQYNDPFDPTRLLYENYLPIHAVLFERALFLAGCQFDETLDIYEDWDFWLQLRQTGPFLHVDQVSAIYRINLSSNQGTTAQQGLIQTAWAALLHKWRTVWSDAELLAVCTLAKDSAHHQRAAAQYQAECQTLRGTLALTRQHSEQEVQQLSAQLQEAAHTLQAQSAAFSEKEARWQLQLEGFTEAFRAREQALEAHFQGHLQPLIDQLRAQKQVIERLSAIEQSTIWRASYPYRAVMGKLRTIAQQWRKKPVECLPEVPESVNPHPIDVIIPVYKGFAQTQACIHSVLATVSGDVCHIIVINDASPDAALTDWLRTLPAQCRHLTVLENAENLGFVQTCNRGMALHPERDVVLLNSDAVVFHDWLTRLQRCAYHGTRIGTVTPFSNNATICSYPRFCEDNPMPMEQSSEMAAWDKLFARHNAGQSIEIPTAVGFCMYIRRACLETVGLFDAYHFGKGYGEENDFCMRARAQGWRHMLCADLFVYHEGSVSFADHQNEKKRRAAETLHRLHPSYDALVQAHITQNPAILLRARIDLLRLQGNCKPGILLVTHAKGGGTQKHVEEWATAFVSQLNVLVLQPDGPFGHCKIAWLHPKEALTLYFRLPTDITALYQCLSALNVQRVHIHHLWEIHPLVLSLPEHLSIPCDITLHDYYFCCPQITLTDHRNAYCGEPSETACNRCLIVNVADNNARDIASWREKHRILLSKAARVFAPSQDVVQRMSRYFPEQQVLWAPHLDMQDVACPNPQPALLQQGAPLHIAVLGALGAAKGADVLEACAIDAAIHDLPIKFTLIGYAYRALYAGSAEHLKIHGPYQDAALPDLLDTIRPDVIWFPAQIPETYSYTLSTCLQAGLPVVVPDLGAFPERIAGRPWSWVRPWRQSAAEWNRFFVRIRSEHFITGASPVPFSSVSTAQPFLYHRDYWPSQEMPPHCSTEAAQAILAVIASDHAAPRLNAIEQRRAFVKGRLLTMAKRLRRSPLLRHVVQWVPFKWQWQMREWLR